MKHHHCLPSYSALLRLWVALAIFLFPAACLAAENHTLGNTELRLSGPADHSRIDPKLYPPLMLVPDRYKGLTKHLISIYSSKDLNRPSKLYNNHGALFFAGSSKKVWTRSDFALLKNQLMPAGQELSQKELQERSEFLRGFLKDNADLSLSRKKALKYYNRLQQATVLHNAENAVILVYRHKKKGEKDKYVTVSLALVRDKLIGTGYYQVAADRKERDRAAKMTMAWQKAILDANRPEAKH